MAINATPPFAPPVEHPVQNVDEQIDEKTISWNDALNLTSVNKNVTEQLEVQNDSLLENIIKLRKIENEMLKREITVTDKIAKKLKIIIKISKEDGDISPENKEKMNKLVLFLDYMKSSNNEICSSETFDENYSMYGETGSFSKDASKEYIENSKILHKNILEQMDNCLNFYKNRLEMLNSIYVEIDRMEIN